MTRFLRQTALLFTLFFAVQAHAKPPESLRAYVAGRWGQIHVRVAGPASGPTVILLHKMFWTSVQFEKVQPLLAERGIRTIAVDLPGYGLSDAPPQEPTATEYADALIPVLDAFKARRPVVLGVDTGSSIALAFAQAHPDRVSRLIFDGAPIFDPVTARKLIDAPHFDRTAQNDAATFTKRWAAIAASVPAGALTPENIQTSMLQFFQASPNYWWAHDAIFKYDFAGAIRTVQTTGMLLSFPGGALHPQEVQFTALRPDYRVIPIAVGSLLMPSFDAPVPWSKAVGDYVLSLPDDRQ